MKWIGLCMILVGCGGIGISASAEYLSRLTALRKIERMLGLLQDEIAIHKVTLAEAIRVVQDRMEGKYKQFLKEVGTLLEDFQGEDISIIWKSKAGIIKQDLKKQDYELFLNCMDQTGFLDAASQEKSLNRYRQAFQDQMEVLVQKKEETCKLYQTIGFLAGIFFCVLLI